MSEHYLAAVAQSEICKESGHLITLEVELGRGQGLVALVEIPSPVRLRRRFDLRRPNPAVWSDLQDRMYPDQPSPSHITAPERFALEAAGWSCIRGRTGAAFRTNSSKSSQRRPDVTTSDRVRDRPCKALKLLICCATLGSLLRLKVGLRHRVQLPLSPRVILAGVGAMLGAESPDDKFRERLTERAFEAEVVFRGVRKRVTVDECVDVVIPPLASADTVLVATVDAPVGCHEIRHVEGRIFRPFLDEDGET